MLRTEAIPVTASSSLDPTSVKTACRQPQSFNQNFTLAIVLLSHSNLKTIIKYIELDLLLQ